MILVDRNKLDPESPVEDILPEFSKIMVLEGFDGDKPKLRAPRAKATIRQLATQTSGLEYEFWNSSILDYQQKTGTAGILAGTKAALFYPMVTDPGTRWGYGIGIDWLGQAVEKIDGRRIDCREPFWRGLIGSWCKSLSYNGIIRARSNSTPARPYMARLRVFSLLICPSVCPLLQGSDTAFRTASRSWRIVLAKRCIA